MFPPLLLLPIIFETYFMSEFWRRVDEELEYKGIKLGSTPSAETAVKIAKVLEVSVEYLVTGQETPKKSVNSDVNELLHDIRHLSDEDLHIAKTVIHRLTVPVSQKL